MTSPYSREMLRECCARIFWAQRKMGLDAAKEDLVRLGFGQDELVSQIRQEWCDLTGEPANDWPWNDGYVVLIYIKYRKETDQKKKQRIPKPFPLLTVEQGYVYFFWEGARNRIKIGFSDKDPVHRLRQLQTAHSDELQIIGWMDGTITHERALHFHFAALKTRPNGEWFRGDAELRAFIQKLDHLESGFDAYMKTLDESHE